MADMADQDALGRQEAELALIQAMYPEANWNAKRQELTYRPEAGGTLTLRLPKDYPGKSTPELVSATAKDKTDLRDLAQHKIYALDLPPDEEALDSILQAFDELVKNQHASRPVDQISAKTSSKPSFKTVIIWLHHLLNTNKRKLALNPSVNSDAVQGITKPGYPGVLIYSGTADAVDAHVAELKDQRWQAFQVRFDEPGDSPWRFLSPGRVVEVETMAEVTKNIQDDANRQTFLKAIGVK